MTVQLDDNLTFILPVGDFTVFGKLTVFGKSILQLTKIGKVVIMLTLFGKWLLIAFWGDYPPYSNSFWGSILRKKSE